MVILVALGLAVGCSPSSPSDTTLATTPETAATSETPAPAAATTGTEPVILLPVYFYHGFTVGRKNPPSGLQVSRDGGRQFTCVTWTEQITSSAAVGPEGRWVYAACGNGVMVSRDAGQTWRLTGGWEMTEVQRVAVDRENGQRAWAATAYGVFRTDDITAPAGGWRSTPHTDLFRFCTDVHQDVEKPDTVWAAGEQGVFVSRDRAATFEPCLTGVRVRRIHQDPNDPKRLWAATDGQGLQASLDRGQNWTRVKGTPEVTFSVTAHPTRPGTLLVGTMDGLYETADHGLHWTHTRVGLPEDFYIYGAAVDPSDPDHLLVGGNNGLFERRGADKSWHAAGFERALIPDLVVSRLARMPREKPDEKPGTLRFASADQDFAEHRESTVAGFEKRRQAMLDHFRALPLPENRPWPGDLRALSLVQQGKADDALWKALQERLSQPDHSMFFTLPLMTFYLHTRDRMPAAVQDRIRQVLTEVPIYRGDTENHWVMHYSVLLLAAQTWPETPASRWYMGRSTQEVYDEARGWLMHWARLTAARGQGEFDSPNYMYMYIAPLTLVYDFAREPAVKQLAGMALDLLLGDYLTESLGGAYCGGHSRIIGKEVELTTANRVSALHYLYAGGIPRPEKLHGWSLFAALCSYRPPAIFATIGNQRDRPYVHTELKRVRNAIRFSTEQNPPVHKYDFMTPLYGLGSLQGGILQPIQQHTWDVTWRGSQQNATFFTVHPSVSGQELGMFFPEDVRDITRTISHQKGVYGSADKWISASAHERIFQHEHVLLALYQVPAGEIFPHVQAYEPSWLTLEEKNGWRFGRDGEFFLAWHACQPGTWTDEGDHRRYRCPAGQAGFVVVVRPREGDRMKPLTFEAFQRLVLDGQAPRFTGEGDDLTLAFATADGTSYARTWGEPTGRVNDQLQPFPAAWLFRGPFLQSRADTRVITLTDGEAKRILDFNTFRIEVPK